MQGLQCPRAARGEVLRRVHVDNDNGARRPMTGARNENTEGDEMKLGYMAVGHMGTRHQLTDPAKHPRGQLLEQCYKKHAAKMYVGTKDGGEKHIGYIVGGEWFRIYEVHEWAGR